MAQYEIKKPRPSRVRETAPMYGEPAYGGAAHKAPTHKAPTRRESEHAEALRPMGFKVTVAERGRMVLPAEVRERLKIKNGDWLTLVLEPNGEIRMLTGAVYASRLRGMFKHLGKPGRSMADELIADRRREAAMEQREVREMIARRRHKAKA